jgi:hypothetical protein
MSISEKSGDAGVPAVKGEYTGTGPTYVHDGGKGVQGHSQNGWGVHGFSEVGRGVVASSDTNYGLRATSRTLAAARCSSVEGTGVEGEAGGAGAGVLGTSKSGSGIHGISETGFGVFGESTGGYGLRATSRKSAGIRGSSDEGRGVEGWAVNSEGVVGISTSGTGVWGQTEGNGAGVLGTSKSGIGVWGISETYEGMHAETKSTTTAALAAYQMNAGSDTAALYAKHAGNRTAAVFEGDVVVTGDIRLTNADCAEDFDIAGLKSVEPGTVMVIDSEGALKPSDRAYDKRVAGVISGAGNYKPGIVLDKQESSKNRMPIALLGKVYCKVDANYGAIKVGDLLTTSPTLGHAMKTDDPLKAFGAVIGKALRSLEEGQRLIPILIALQ